MGSQVRARERVPSRGDSARVHVKLPLAGPSRSCDLRSQGFQGEQPFLALDLVMRGAGTRARAHGIWSQIQGHRPAKLQFVSSEGAVVLLGRTQAGPTRQMAGRSFQSWSHLLHLGAPRGQGVRSTIHERRRTSGQLDILQTAGRNLSPSTGLDSTESTA